MFSFRILCVKGVILSWLLACNIALSDHWTAFFPFTIFYNFHNPRKQASPYLFALQFIIFISFFKWTLQISYCPEENVSHDATERHHDVISGINDLITTRGKTPFGHIKINDCCKDEKKTIYIYLRHYQRVGYCILTMQWNHKYNCSKRE